MLPDNIIEIVNAALPSSIPPEAREDIIQDIMVMICEGVIGVDTLAADVAAHLPELKKRYPSLMFQFSLDAPVNNREGTTMTFMDVIVGPSTIQPKRRGKYIGRPVVRKAIKSTCEYCEKIFYWKPYAGSGLTKKQQKRLSFLPEIDPRFWTDEDLYILKIGNPQLLCASGRNPPRRTGRFCSRNCLTGFFRDKRRKLPGKDVLVDLYVNQKLSTCKIQKLYGVTDPGTVRKALLKYGVTLRKGKETATSVCTAGGRTKPAHKIKHANNGSIYGTLCRYHWKLHRAELNRRQKRKDNAIPPERWKYDAA